MATLIIATLKQAEKYSMTDSLNLLFEKDMWIVTDPVGNSVVMVKVMIITLIFTPIATVFVELITDYTVFTKARVFKFEW